MSTFIGWEMSVQDRMFINLFLGGFVFLGVRLEDLGALLGLSLFTAFACLLDLATTGLGLVAEII